MIASVDGYFYDNSSSRVSYSRKDKLASYYAAVSESFSALTCSFNSERKCILPIPAASESNDSSSMRYSGMEILR